jgi:hypothetical protein
MVVFFVRFVSQLFAAVQDIRGFQKSEAGRVSVSSANHALKIVRSALRDAFRDGLIHTNPPNEFAELKEPRPQLKGDRLRCLNWKNFLKSPAVNGVA